MSVSLPHDQPGGDLDRAESAEDVTSTSSRSCAGMPLQIALKPRKGPSLIATAAARRENAPGGVRRRTS